MAEGNQKPEQRNGSGPAEVVRRGAAAARTAGEAGRQGPKAGAEVIGRAGDATGEASRTGQALVAEATRSTVEAARQGTQAGAEVIDLAGTATGDASRTGQALVAEAARSTVEAARQAAAPAAEVQQAGAEVIRKAADTASRGPGAVAEEAQRTARSLWAGSQDMWRMLPGQAALPASLPDIPQAFAGLFGDMVRANLRISQEMVRLANPVALIELQQTLVRGYLDAIVAGQSMLLGAARGTAEDALRRAGQQGR